MHLVVVVVCWMLMTMNHFATPADVLLASRDADDGTVVVAGLCYFDLDYPHPVPSMPRSRHSVFHLFSILHTTD